MPLFPPRRRKAFHESVLDEILEERVVARRGRRNRRGVKRKMSSYPLGPNGPPLPRSRISRSISESLSDVYWG